MSVVPILEFIHRTQFRDIPASTIHAAHRSLYDTLGIAVSGSRTDLSRIISDHAASHFGAGNVSARILLDGRSVSPAGAALAGGMTIDAIDAHDGFAPAKGHIGAALVPSLLAFTDAIGEISAEEFMACIVIGYELACRSSIAQHGTVPDYHTSGSWMAVAVAGVGARLLGLDEEQTRHALGIAEYHGPRSQMIRGVDYPTMLKDGAGWGAMAGVSAAYLAADGFTGAPAAIMEFDNVREYWDDLGQVWLTEEQYFKPQPVCRWAHPPVQAIVNLKVEHDFTSADVERITVTTFNEATHIATREPRNTEEAQYSLPFPVAAMLVRGKLGYEEVNDAALTDPEILRLSIATDMKERDDYNDAFPARRFADVTLHMKDGRKLESGRTEACGTPEDPLTDDELTEKLRTFASPVIGGGGCDKLLSIVADVANGQGNSRPLQDFMATAART